MAILHIDVTALHWPMKARIVGCERSVNMLPAPTVASVSLVCRFDQRYLLRLVLYKRILEMFRYCLPLV